MPTYDPVPEITRKHFEDALKTARKSVTNVDLQKFEDFKKKFDPSFAKGSGGSSSSGGLKLNWPSSGGSSKMQVEDDLYT